MMNRRDLLRHGSVAAGALGLSALPLQWTAAAEPTSRKKVLMFTRSQGFEHSVVKRKNADLIEEMYEAGSRTRSGEEARA